MIERGIIEEVISSIEARVRIPMLHKSKDAPGCTPSSELPIATMCNLPNCKVSMAVGDIVFVGFEAENYSRPVILGYLLSNTNTASLLTIGADAISLASKAVLPSDTMIGKVKPSDLYNLLDCTENIQQQIDSIQSQDKSIQQQILNLRHQVSDLQQDLNERRAITHYFSIVDDKQESLVCFSITAPAIFDFVNDGNVSTLREYLEAVTHNNPVCANGQNKRTGAYIYAIQSSDSKLMALCHDDLDFNFLDYDYWIVHDSLD